MERARRGVSGWRQWNVADRNVRPTMFGARQAAPLRARQDFPEVKKVRFCVSVSGILRETFGETVHGIFQPVERDIDNAEIVPGNRIMFVEPRRLNEKVSRFVNSPGAIGYFPEAVSYCGTLRITLAQVA
jgi:hypothetical protein